MPIAGHGDSWLRRYVPYQIYRTSNKLNQRIRSRLKKNGVNIARWRVMSVLRAYGELSLGRIVDLTAMEQPTVSRIVSQLEREDLAGRAPSEDDSRVVLVSLTDKGEQAFQNIYPAAERHAEIALKDFSDDEIEQLIGYLRRIQDNIEVHD